MLLGERAELEQVQSALQSTATGYTVAVRKVGVHTHMLWCRTASSMYVIMAADALCLDTCSVMSSVMLNPCLLLHSFIGLFIKYVSIPRVT